FTRIAEVLPAGGRFVLADLIVPADPTDVVTPIDGVEDTPSALDAQLDWLAEAGLATRVHWHHRDLAVVSADAPRPPAECTGDRTRATADSRAPARCLSWRDECQ